MLYHQKVNDLLFATLFTFCIVLTFLQRIYVFVIDLLFEKLTFCNRIYFLQNNFFVATVLLFVH